MNRVQDLKEQQQRVVAQRQAMVGRFCHVMTGWGAIPGIIMGHGGSYEAGVAVNLFNTKAGFVVLNIAWDEIVRV